MIVFSYILLTGRLKFLDRQKGQRTKSSAVAERPRDASSLTVVSFNSRPTIPRVQYFIISYFGFGFTIKLCSVVFCVTSSLFVINKIYWCVARRRLLIAGDGRHTRAITYRHTRPSKCWWHTRRTSTPDICRESRFFHTEPAFDAPVRGVFVGILPYRSVRKNETGVATRRWKRLMICLAVSIEHRRVTDGQTDGQTCCDGIVHAIHSIARYSERYDTWQQHI